MTYFFFRVALLVMLLSLATPGHSQIKLDTIRVAYCDVNGATQYGEIICNKKISAKLVRIFDKLHKAKYPIERITPISDYNDDDEASMTANNTSCYCYRNVAGSKHLSKHAMGLAIDLNPLYNPCIRFRDGKIQPKAGAPYAHNRKKDKTLPVSKIDHYDLACKLFHEEGFTWGGDWKTLKDYQHFEYNK